MNRRDFLKLLLSAPIAYQLDVEKLLWVPGEKTIFLPPAKSFSMAEIVVLEMERTLPHIKSLFDRQDVFYQTLKGSMDLRGNEIKIPITIKPRK